MIRGFISVRMCVSVFLLMLPACVLANQAAAATGTVTGLVLDRNTSAPLAGARVVLTGMLTTETLTNGNGEFRFDRVQPGAATINAHKYGYITLYPDRITVIAGGVTTHNVRLRPGRTDFKHGNLAGLVKIWQTGQLVPGQRVYYENPFVLTGWSYVITDAQSKFRIDNLDETGLIFLWVEVPGYTTCIVQPRVVPDTTTSVTLLVYPPGEYNVLTGTVTDRSTGFRVPGAKVYYHMLGSANWYYAVTSANGFFGLYDKLMVGTYELRAERDGYLPQTITATVMVSIAECEVFFRLVPLGPNEGSIVGQIVDALTSAPLPGARVVAVSSVTQKMTEIASNSFGEFRFDQLPAGHGYTIYTAKNGYLPVSARCTVPSGGTAHCTLAMRQPPRRNAAGRWVIYQ